MVRPTYAMKRSTISVLVLLACGCSRPSEISLTASTSPPSASHDAQTTQLRQKLKSVTLADGISKSEAKLIAECYFHQNIGCGGFTGVRDGLDCWIVDGAFGVAAEPIRGFYIAKGTGMIVSPIGPSYATPFEIFP